MILASIFGPNFAVVNDRIKLEVNTCPLVYNLCVIVINLWLTMTAWLVTVECVHIDWG